MSIASFLRKHKIKTRVADLGKELLPWEFRPDIVGIGATTPYYLNAIRVCREVRQKIPHVKIVLGGSHFTASPEDAPPEADAVVSGEGEKAMLQICLEGIKDRLIQGESLDNLDRIPIESEDLLDVLYKGRQARLHVLGARGCPFSCAFCAEHSRKIRLHSVEYLFEKLKLIVRKYHNLIFFSDDIFTLNKQWAYDLCESILRAKLKLRFFANGHIRYFDRNLLIQMKKTGLERLCYGIESGNQEILKLIRKGFTVEEAEETIARTRETGIEMNLLYMVGNMGETQQTIQDTVDFALSHNTQKWCSYAIPFPGTEFRRQAVLYGKIVSHDYDLYTNDHINYLPHGVSAEFLENARNKILFELYQRYSVRQRLSRQLKRLF